jgi:hypothetical protein
MYPETSCPFDVLSRMKTIVASFPFLTASSRSARACTWQDLHTMRSRIAIAGQGYILFGHAAIPASSALSMLQGSSSLPSSCWTGVVTFILSAVLQSGSLFSSDLGHIHERSTNAIAEQNCILFGHPAILPSLARSMLGRGNMERARDGRIAGCLNSMQFCSAH